MWNDILVRQVAKEVLGESRGDELYVKGSWWWKEKVQKAIKAK